MSHPRISVVMPIYNVEAYVEQAINSVLEQSFRDFELICVDDGGNDRSMDIVRGFSDPRIRIVSQTNRGLAGARNTGISQARGEYIALLDSDDIWHKDKLVLHYVHLTANPEIGVSYAGSRLIDRQGNPLGVTMTPKMGLISARDIICRNPVGNGSAAVIRRSVLAMAATRHPIEHDRVCWFDEDFRQSEDIEMWVRLAVKHGVKFAGIAGLLTDYRIIPGALSANVVKQYLSWTKMLRKLKGYAPEFVEKYGETARAYQLRYLARRSLQLGNFGLARDFLRRALGRSPRIMIEEPLKTVVTAAAILIGTLVGRDRFTIMMRPFLKEAV